MAYADHQAMPVAPDRSGCAITGQHVSHSLAVFVHAVSTGAESIDDDDSRLTIAGSRKELLHVLYAGQDGHCLYDSQMTVNPIVRNTPSSSMSPNSITPKTINTFTGNIE